jgi:hypothetical protein
MDALKDKKEKLIREHGHQTCTASTLFAHPCFQRNKKNKNKNNFKLLSRMQSTRALHSLNCCVMCLGVLGFFRLGLSRTCREKGGGARKRAKVYVCVSVQARGGRRKPIRLFLQERGRRATPLLSFPSFRHLLFSPSIFSSFL